MNKVEIPTNCFFQGSYNPAFEAEIEKCKDKCRAYNQLRPYDRESQQRLLAELLGKMGKDVIMTPPLWFDYGYHIEVGDNFFSNHNLVIQDGGKVTFGDSVFIGPNVCFTTAEHAIDPELRRQGVEVARPIVVGNNVWIGAGSTILAGAVIGDNAVIGAGSVVKGEIPGNTVAVGVPCRPIREISKADKTAWPCHPSLG